MMRRLCLVLLAASALMALTAPPVFAQDAPKPAFSVSTSRLFHTRERPSFDLLFRQVDHLDFRVYRVNDSFAFFEALRDPHQLGSE